MEQLFQPLALAAQPDIVGPRHVALAAYFVNLGHGFPFALAGPVAASPSA
jgi:hypothetical protein